MSLRCRGLSKTYETRNGPIAALEDVSLEVGEDEFLCVVGPSGCGKSTLLRIVAGLLPPSGGEIGFDGLGDGSGTHVAMVFQEDGLFPWQSLEDNVAFGLERFRLPRRERRERAGAILERVGLAGFRRNFPHELSVGMRQRANIARALVSEPHVLLMDEPFGALDAQTRVVMQEELLRLWAEDRRPVVYVTHDIREAVLLGDRVLVMSGRPGRIREEIGISLDRPRDPTRQDPPEVAEIVERIWKALEEEVRRLR